jgi:hypothetical protein
LQIAHFCGLTGAEASVATQFLEMMNGDLDQAISMFLDMGSGGGGSSATGPRMSVPTPSMATDSSDWDPYGAINEGGGGGGGRGRGTG